jgi:hypothetical protein
VEIQKRGYVLCNKEDGWSQKLRCEENGSCRDQVVDKRLTSIESEIGVRRIAAIKDSDKPQEVGLYLSKYKD